MAVKPATRMLVGKSQTYQPATAGDLPDSIQEPAGRCPAFHATGS
ncbi:MAG: hypothetical protein R6V52_00365 [Bacteroidales bacterium]